MKKEGRAVKSRRTSQTNHKKARVNWRILLFCFGAVFLFATISSLLTYEQVGGTWYNLVKPSITPPSWVFAVTWSILFFFIALSLYFAWTKAYDKKSKLKLEIVFGINFILGVAWSFLFFTLRKPSYAFFDLILFWISIIAMIIVTHSISKKSAWLLIPYLVWVSFAGALNYLTIIG